jgi:agmatinase
VGSINVDPVDDNTENPFSQITEAVRPLVEIEKFPIIIGGEHSISTGAARACIDKYPDLSILHIDAHCNLRTSYEGNSHGNASVAYQLYKMLPKPNIAQVGVRNISWEEVAWMEEEEPNINIFWARNQDKWDVNEILNTLSDQVYLSISVDSLDSGIMPATGHPEPGGLSWYNLLELIKLVCVRKHVVAADLTELSPIAGLTAPNFLAAKLIYKLIGYRFALDLGVTKKYL